MRSRERERDAMELFLLVSVVDGGKRREVEKGEEKGRGREVSRLQGVLWVGFG